MCNDYSHSCLLYTSSEQHVELREIRIAIKDSDVNKLYDWVINHSPFSKTQIITSLGTGIIGNDAVSYTHLDVYKRQPPIVCMHLCMYVPHLLLNHWTDFNQTWHKYFTQRENQHRTSVFDTVLWVLKTIRSGYYGNPIE